MVIREIVNNLLDDEARKLLVGHLENEMLRASAAMQVPAEFIKDQVSLGAEKTLSEIDFDSFAALNGDKSQVIGRRLNRQSYAADTKVFIPFPGANDAVPTYQTVRGVFMPDPWNGVSGQWGDKQRCISPRKWRKRKVDSSMRTIGRRKRWFDRHPYSFEDRQ